MSTSKDKIICISFGTSRKETHWKRKELTWGDFVEKLRHTVRTNETQAQYFKGTKDFQDSVKDVGGFVGGELTGGRRKSGSVLNRYILTLDIDNAELDFWDTFQMYYDAAAVCYQTHKHTPEKPRLRLVVLLSRPLNPDEYEPVGRYVAGTLGIEQFDDTTFEPERLMYWPSTSADGSYSPYIQDGNPLNVDKILSHYGNYRDASEWPHSIREDAVRKREAKQQGNPEEKPGVVGAFCRTYNIYTAIDAFLSDVYSVNPNDDKRYTYVHGSTANGLIVYEDGLFAYSHHGTDPAGGKLCNAFDLVRLHKFAEKDENVKPDTPINKYPSYLAMEDLCRSNKAVRKTIANEKLKEAGEDFASMVEAEDESKAWLEKMDADKKGNYESTINNIRLILENDPNLKDCFATNDFSNESVMLKLPPWQRKNGKPGMIFDDSDFNSLLVYFGDDPWRIKAQQQILGVLGNVFRDHKFNPVKNYLDSLLWDGTKRLDTIFIDYLGAEDTPFNRAITRIIFTAAVTRVYEPGTKFDNVVVLVGKQGCGKSTILQKMAVRDEWFSDSLPSPEDPKNAPEHLQGRWIIEMSELVAMKKATAEANKSFISKTTDKFRPSYGKRTIDRPRRCVFFGTTNEDKFLKDATGNRRYWPMKVAVSEPKYSIWNDLNDLTINQIWAEAVENYNRRMSLVLSSKFRNEIEEVQDEHTDEDEWVGIIEEFLNVRLPDNWSLMGSRQRKDYFVVDMDDNTKPIGKNMRMQVCTAEVLNECPYLGTRSSFEGADRKRICNCINKIQGWTYQNKAVRVPPYGVQKIWVRDAE